MLSIALSYIAKKIKKPEEGITLKIKRASSKHMKEWVHDILR